MKCLTFSFAVLMGQLLLTECSYYSEEVNSLTASQKAALEKFRKSVEHLLTHDYMKEDIFLVRFLKLKDFCVRDSIEAIKEAMEWRRKNNVDNIMKEDFSDIESELPLYFDGIDRQGRPIMEGNFGSFPMRTMVGAGKLKKMKRYTARLVEIATTKVRELRETNGSNVTQWVMLLNMKDFTMEESACPCCLPYYLAFMAAIEKYHPYSMGLSVLVNTPDSFQNLLTALRPVMSAQTEKALKVFNDDEEKWKKYVNEYFDPQEIAKWFGGKKARKGKN